jgi:two-component sensor histidine kinase
LRSRPPSTKAYVLAVLCVTAASLLRWVIGYVTDDVFVFASYYPAVLFATYVGGATVGIFAALLSAVIGWWAFIPPHFAYTPLTPDVATKLLAFLVASALIVWGADRYRRLMERLESEEELRNLAVSELGHRLKNKIATIQSVISVKLRDDPQTKAAILGVLNSLSATDDLILATQGNGARIRDIFGAEISPYDISRASMEGPDVLLPPTLAMTMALVVHELATNSAKYGALAAATGKLSIGWAISDGNMTINWRERDGPAVAPLTHRGFGTQLLSRAFTQFGGSIESSFEPNGLTCKMSLALPQESEPAAGNGPAIHSRPASDRIPASTAP